MTEPGIPSIFRKRRRQLFRAFPKTIPGQVTAALAARFGGQTPRRVLLLSDGVAYTSEQQFAPLIRHATAIARRTGMVFTFGDLAQARALQPGDLAGWHAVGLKLSFTMPGNDAVALAEQVFGAARQAGCHAIYFDGDDDQAVLWPGVVDAADVYLKKHMFRDPGAYEAPMVGKSNLTDYCHRSFGVSFEDDIIPQTPALNGPQIAKLRQGWNIALDDKLVELAEDIPASVLDAPRKTDVTCRASVAPDIWTHKMRDAAVQAINALSGELLVHAPTDRVPQAAYYREMLDARFSVSPFGFGELCWRDFEAILCGSVLVKPDMSHVRTAPDIFLPGETYIPVAWDYSDLGTAIRPYVDDESRRRAMAGKARAQLVKMLSRDWFVDRFEHVMREASLL